MSQISDYTFEKLIKYDFTKVDDLITDFEIEIKALELKLQYRKTLRFQANAFTRPIIPRGTKIHTRHPKSIYNKYMESYDVTTRRYETKLETLKDENQRVLLNQSLRGIENFTSVKFTPFVFTPSVINSSWSNASIVLGGETSRLESKLSEWKNKLLEEIKKDKILKIENEKRIIEEKRVQRELEKELEENRIKEEKRIKEIEILRLENLEKLAQIQQDLESQQNSFIEPVILENLFKDDIPEIKTDMIIEEKQVSILPVENNNSMYILAGLGLITGLIYFGVKK